MKKYLISSLLIVVLMPSASLLAGGKKPIPFDGKKVIELAPVQNVQIEMPDQSFHNFGEDFQASLTTHLFKTGKYTIADPVSANREFPSSNREDYKWPGSAVPAIKIRVHIGALSFQTGLRGDRMFYGFDERNHSPFNDGTSHFGNEFPLKTLLGEVSWFGRTFDRKGIAPFDSRSGLDLGDGFQIDALMAWMNLKYAWYHAEIRLKLEMQLPTSSISTFQNIEVHGDGFYFDAAGNFENYSVGIRLARRDAMRKALMRVIAGSAESIEQTVSPLPLMAQIDAVLVDNTVILGTGPFSEVKPGILYVSVDNPQLVVQVESTVEQGSLGKVIHGEVSWAKAGMILRQVKTRTVSGSRPVSRDLATLEEEGDLQTNPNSSVKLADVEIPKSSEAMAVIPEISRALAAIKSLIGAATIPYRIGRYFLYNQTYHAYPDLFVSASLNWIGGAWREQIGLRQAPAMAEASPIVAVIDSGVDYNHPVVHGSIWLNPNPWKDPTGRQDRYGWDFISGDSKPYDDGYHGTQVASLIATVAPKAKIMPLKVFNPWGITNSAALYGAFTYAVDHGAQIIVCAWSTSVRSKALEMGISYARDHGVVVVAAAGDDGMSLSFSPSYPASFNSSWDNVIAVTGVDSSDQLVRGPTRPANYDSTLVQIAGPGKNLFVAEPRLGATWATSTGLAAAVVAGALARNVAAAASSENYTDWIQTLLDDADSVESLNRFVRGGLRVHIRR
jgi:thermitase